MRLLLLPFSWVYGLVMFIRNLAFDFGVLKSENVGVPVISVGNMTMGGTGKTPLVEYIVGKCIAKGRKVAVVSRGYKRKSEGTVVVSDGRSVLVDAALGGDEPLQIARKFPDVAVVVGEKRVDAVRKAIDDLGVNTIVLDDGFQHRYLRRDLDIVVIDSRKDLFQIPMIPAGAKREPLASIKRAHVVAFSRADKASETHGWMNALDNKYHIPHMRYRYRLAFINQAGSGNKLASEDLKTKKFFLFSGIGDHKGFVDQMMKEGITVAGDLGFPDHHTYVRANVKQILDGAIQSEANGLLTSEKDVARLMADKSLFSECERSLPLYYAGIAVDILSGKETLDSMIDDCLKRRLA